MVDRAQGRNLTDEERNAVKAALEYFRTGGQRHTADEEESLFPRLRKSNAKSFEEIDRLEDDHREANDLHGSVERLYSAWIESGSLGSEEAQQLRSQTARLKQLYSDHIQVEETIVFARAIHVLDSHAIAAIGTEFRFRQEVALCGIFVMPTGSTNDQQFAASHCSLHAGVTGLSCVGNQIHIHVAWQIRLPMPSSLRHYDQAQEDASENCCNGNG